jgi:hypothetical protein
MKVGTPMVPILTWKVELHVNWANACPGMMPSIRNSRMPVTRICGNRNLETIDCGTFIYSLPLINFPGRSLPEKSPYWDLVRTTDKDPNPFM